MVCLYSDLSEREKGRDLAQSYDKNPYTNRVIKMRFSEK